MSKRQRTEGSSSGKSSGKKGSSNTARMSTGGSGKVPAAMRQRQTVFNMYRNPRDETHYVDIPVTTSNVSDTAVMVLLNGTLEGSGAYNRIGRRIQLKSLYLNGHFVLKQGVGPATYTAKSGSAYARVMVIYDAQANGAAPSALSDILLGETSSGATSTTAFSPNNMANRGRFSVLIDERRSLPLVPVAANYTPQYDPEDCLVQRYIRLKELVTEYKASTGAVSDITTGSLYLIIVSDEAAASYTWQFVWSARTKFKE